MHTAPTVEYPVGPSRFHDALFNACWCAAASVFVGWWVLADGLDVRRFLGLVLALAAFGVSAWMRRRPAVGVLQWDGLRWGWESGSLHHAGDLTPCLDLQRVLLLRFDGENFRIWLWVERVSAPQRWDSLRRAVAEATAARSTDTLSSLDEVRR